MSPIWLTLLWPWALLLVAAYCLAQTVRDFRARRYAWAVAGIACLALLLLTPLSSHAVKFDLPPGTAR